MTRHILTLLIMLAWAALWASGGGLALAAPTQAPAPAPAEAQPKDKAPAQTDAKPQAPAQAPTQAQDPGAAKSPRVCVWLFWAKDQRLLAKVRDRMSKGEPFMSAALAVHGEHQADTRPQANCMELSGLDPAVIQALAPLAMGQVSGTFAFDQGWAMLMRTTDLYRREAQELFHQGKFSEAENALLEDLRLHPASAPAWHLLGLTRSARGEYQDALSAFEKGLRWDPNNPSLLNDQASALATMGEYAKAVPIYQRAADLDPSNPTILSNLAWALSLAGRDLTKAQDLAQQAVRRAPGEPRFWYNLARVQQAQGQHAQAVVSLHRSLKLNPEQTDARRRLTQSLLALDEDTVARLTKKAAPARPGPAPAAPRPARPQPLDREVGPKPEPRAVQTQSPARYWLIQVATYPEDNMARTELKSWKRFDLTGWVEPWRDDKKHQWYRVLLGPWLDGEKARAKAEELKKKGIIRQYRLVEREPQG